MKFRLIIALKLIVSGTARGRTVSSVTNREICPGTRHGK